MPRSPFLTTKDESRRRLLATHALVQLHMERNYGTAGMPENVFHAEVHEGIEK
jgi:hypothetical protein